MKKSILILTFLSTTFSAFAGHQQQSIQKSSSNKATATEYIILCMSPGRPPFIINANSDGSGTISSNSDGTGLPCIKTTVNGTGR